MTSNAHMRFVFKWFLDIFLNVCAIFYNQGTLRTYVKLQILPCDTLEYAYLTNSLAIYFTYNLYLLLI